MNGPQDVFWSGCCELQLQPERWPGDRRRVRGRGEALPGGLRRAFRRPGLHHDFRLPEQLRSPAAVLQIQEAAHAGEHAAAQHQRQRHAGVFVWNHTQLRLQHPGKVAAGARRLQLVRIHQLLLRYVSSSVLTISCRTCPTQFVFAI